jgi:hypothetical protein
VSEPAPPAVAALTPGEFEDRFTGLFQREAFRLETLDWYDSPGTDERVRRFLAGQPDDPAIRAGWDELLAEARAAGKRMSRVHVVTEPLSDYLRFELDFYRGSAAAGEDIRILPRSRVTGLDLPGFDFWLMDGTTAAVMTYGDRGLWLGVQVVTDPGFAARCRTWRDTAMACAMTLRDYTARSAA